MNPANSDFKQTSSMLFATDIANFLACQHIATFNREQAEGKISRKVFADPGAELLREFRA